MARVKLDNLRKVYENGDVAVHAVSVEVRDGEFVVLVGPSGCGKSTTLRMVAGLEAISGGTLTIGDRVVNDLPPKGREIAKLQRALGVTSIYVTHDQVEAMTMGDRIVVLEKGRVQQIDTPLGLYNRPANAFVATFIGSPAMNMVGGAIERGDLSGGLRFRGAGEGDAESSAFVVPLRDAVARRLAAYEGKRVTL